MDDNEKSKNELAPPVAAAINTGYSETFVSLLTRWYDSYIKMVTLVGTISIALLGFSATFIIKEFLTAERWRPAVDLGVLQWSWFFLAISVVSALGAILCGYNWYICAIQVHIRALPEVDRRVTDGLEYQNPRLMKLWGWFSWWTGWIAGIALLFGLIFFVLGASRLVDRIKTAPEPAKTKAGLVVAPVLCGRRVLGHTSGS